MKYAFPLILTVLAVSTALAQTPLTIDSTSQTASLFYADPIKTTSGPDASVEVGTKFTVDIPGKIVSLRFYKMLGQLTGHTVTLWTSSGVQLAQAATSGESSIGWQQVNLSTPVSIVPSTIYIVSYHTTVGYEALDRNFFATPYNNVPMHSSGGVYSYAVATTFPRNTVTSNYYVDVVFMPDHHVTLSWGASPSLGVTYSVFRSTTSSGYDFNSPLAQNITQTGYTDFLVAPGKTYFYVVKAVFQSVPSNETSATIPTP